MCWTLDLYIGKEREERNGKDDMSKNRLDLCQLEINKLLISVD